jgi:hypothetical protein
MIVAVGRFISRDHARVTKVQCLRCLRISEQGSPLATSWDCACGSTYVLRRCAACGAVSQVTSLQRNGRSWDCMWCQAPSGGFAPRNDPQTATIGDFGVDMAAHGLAFTPKASVKRANTALGDTQPDLARVKWAAVAQVVVLIAGFLTLVSAGLMWRIVGYTAMNPNTGVSFLPGSMTGWSEQLSFAPAQAWVLVAVVALVLRGRARWLRYPQIGLCLLALASSVYIAGACAAFTGLGVLYGPLAVGDVSGAIAIVLLALSLRRCGRRPRWHLALVLSAAGAGALLAAVPLITASWGSPYGPGYGTVTGIVAPCSPAEQKAEGDLDTSRVVTVSMQNQAGQTVASQRLPFRTSGSRYRLRLLAGSYTITVATALGSDSDEWYLPADKTIADDFDDDFNDPDNANCVP